MKSSAVDYLASKESYIMPTAFERLAAANKLAIQQGKVTGLTFPVKRKKMGKGCQFKTPRNERIAKVEAVNELRKAGMNARKAADKCGIVYAKYRHWADDLGIKCNYNSRWGDTTNL
jgi:ribosomal protein L13E